MMIAYKFCLENYDSGKDFNHKAQCECFVKKTQLTFGGHCLFIICIPYVTLKTTTTYLVYVRLK